VYKNTGCFKTASQLLKLTHIYSEDVYSASNCRNVAKYTKFYEGDLWFNVTFTGSAGCLKNSFTIVFQMLLPGKKASFIFQLSTP
jgi:hypothetical protein